MKKIVISFCFILFILYPAINFAKSNKVSIPVIIFGKGGIVYNGGQPGLNNICPESCFLCKCAVVKISILSFFDKSGPKTVVNPSVTKELPTEVEIDFYNADGTIYKTEAYQLHDVDINAEVLKSEDGLGIEGKHMLFKKQ